MCTAASVPDKVKGTWSYDLMHDQTPTLLEFEVLDNILTVVSTTRPDLSARLALRLY